MDGDARSHDDDIAAEHWDDEGGHLASERKNADEAMKVPIARSSSGTARSRSPHQIAHFPPL
ncbi:hypothetical protein [Microbacterium sp. 16-032]|uniref:hypothetical protein n=1 Tax=Microbacterium sp. 16-032 TaxID=3239808 RepID=UPI0034E2ABB4